MSAPVLDVHVPAWGGRRAQATVRLVLAEYGTTCHLCGHGCADSADHVVPRSVDPTRTWDLTNLRPAHHHPCPTCGVRCNVARGARLLTSSRPLIIDGTDWID